ncbi:MAG: hypothetical protein K1X83_15165 [Oligoflexia bacterium]|nr:hypothetical protein [Oligoflexia bacterium]
MINSHLMKKYFVPFTGETPASITVNGHRLVILTQDKEALEESLGFIGADHIETVRTGRTQRDDKREFDRIATLARGGVVVAPYGAHVQEIIRNLEAELPWLQ